jgi:hypothetical protein
MRRVILILTLITGITGGNAAIASHHENTETDTKAAVPNAIEATLDYLYQLLDDPQITFDPAKAFPLLDYSPQQAADSPRLTPKRREDSNGSFLSFGVKASLETILQYLYNPDIPKYVILPSLLRLSGWHPESETVTGSTPLWDSLSQIDSHRLLRGRKYEVNTPNPSVGGYYRYELNRLVILMKYRGQPALLSVSKIVKPSEVGKKGVIIDDANWDYFYSDMAGVSHSLIGWANTHIYHSASVIVYVQENADNPRTRVMMFNWLKAGWNGMNVVKSSHIIEGCARFAKNMTFVLESPALPEAADLSDAIKRIKSLPQTVIDNLARQYATAFEQKAKSHPKMAGKDFSRLIAKGGYASLLSREEKLGVLLQEFFKAQIGKQTLVSLPQIDRSGEQFQSYNNIHMLSDQLTPLASVHE